MLKGSSFFVRTGLVGSALLCVMATPALAATTPDAHHIVATTQAPSFHDEQALVINLKMSNKMLEAAIKHGQLSVPIYNNMTKRLTAVMNRLDSGSEFHLVRDLQTVVDSTASLLAINPTTSDQNLLQAHGEALSVYSTVKDQVESLAMTPAGSERHLGDFRLVVNGRALVAHAEKLLYRNTTYVNLNDVEALIHGLTGDKMGPVSFNSKSGRYSQTQDWTPKAHLWNIAWEHTLPEFLNGSQGNAALAIDDTTIVKTDAVIFKQGHTTEVFLPIWAIQQLVDQLIYTTNSTDYFNGATWSIDYNPHQHYNINNVGSTGQSGGTFNLAGSTQAPVTGPGWGQ